MKWRGDYYAVFFGCNKDDQIFYRQGIVENPGGVPRNMTSFAVFLSEETFDFLEENSQKNHNTCFFFPGLFG